jgi:hypothetical protein
MTVAAGSWDPLAERLVTEARSLRIHSVFERALNLVDADGGLVGLVGPPAGDGPATMVLADLPREGLGRLGLQPNAHAELRSGRLAVAERLVVDLRRARRWVPHPTRLTVPAPRARARVAQAERLAFERAPRGGLAELLPHLADLVSHQRAPTPPPGLDQVNRVAWAGLAGLLPAWRDGDLATAVRSAETLIGLGPGLTPSGDDVLAGLCVGARRLGVSGAGAFGTACWELARTRTTDVAVARIRHAADGLAEEIQERALAAVLDPPAGESYAGGGTLEAAVTTAARWGHTSGTDTLVGLFLGARLGLTSMPIDPVSTP